MAGEHVPAALRTAVAERAAGRCDYGKSPSRFATQAFSVEHIVPRSLGRSTTIDNLALAYQGCNNHKYQKTVGWDAATAANVLLFHPRCDDWGQHFLWNEDYTVVIGITPTGRATVEALRLNREGVVNLRRVLFQIGEHPM